MADGLPISLVASASYSFTVAARPQTVGPHEANVIIRSNSTLTPMVSISVHVEGMCQFLDIDLTDAFRNTGCASCHPTIRASDHGPASRWYTLPAVSVS